MFRESFTWNALGRIYHIINDSINEKLFCLCHSFRPILSHVAVHHYSGNYSRDRILTFDDSRYISLCPTSNLVAIHYNGIVTLQKLCEVGEPAGLLDFSFESSSAWFTAIGEDGRIFTNDRQHNIINSWDSKTGQKIYSIRGFLATARSSIIDAKNNLIIGKDRENDSLIKQWNYDNGQEIHTYAGASHFATGVDICREKQMLIGGDLAGKIRLWSLQSGEQIDVFNIKRGIESLAVTLSGKILVVGDRQGKLAIWNLETQTELQVINAHSRARVQGVCILNERMFASGGWNGKLKLWKYVEE